MTGSSADSWLDIGPAAEVCTTPTTDEPQVGAVGRGDDDWLNLEDPNAGRTTGAFQHMISACMRGTDRVMATDGRYLAYRPFNRAFDKETNPRTKERMNMFREKGFYKHLGTFDEVEIYELAPGNPYYHDGNKAYVVGQNYWADIRTAAKLACERKWPEYHDFLGGMATALKGGNRDPAFAKTVWDDTVNQVVSQVLQMRRGDSSLPDEREINEGFIEVRRARGIQGRQGMVLLNSNALQKVEFDK